MAVPSASRRSFRRATAHAKPRQIAALVSVLASLASGCSGLDLGADARLQVEGAQFVRGPLPEPSDGPAVEATSVQHSVVAPGVRGEELRATLGRDAEAAAVGARGDVGYWVVPADSPDPLVPDRPTLLASLALSRDAATGPLDVIVLAADAKESYGHAAVTPLLVQKPSPVDAPLVVTLGWDNEADLDIHVVLPGDVEIWSGNINSYERPGAGEPPDPPDAFRDGAILDVDSNANCVADGRNLENVIWSTEPVDGEYTVRVSAASLCGTAGANWWISVTSGGVLLTTARGHTTSYDTRTPQAAGSGVVALTFVVRASSAGPP